MAKVLLWPIVLRRRSSIEIVQLLERHVNAIMDQAYGRLTTFSLDDRCLTTDQAAEVSERVGRFS